MMVIVVIMLLFWILFRWECYLFDIIVFWLGVFWLGGEVFLFLLDSVGGFFLVRKLLNFLSFGMWFVSMCMIIRIGMVMIMLIIDYSYVYSVMVRNIIMVFSCSLCDMKQGVINCFLSEVRFRQVNLIISGVNRLLKMKILISVVIRMLLIVFRQGMKFKRKVVILNSIGLGRFYVYIVSLMVMLRFVLIRVIVFR